MHFKIQRSKLGETPDGFSLESGRAMSPEPRMNEGMANAKQDATPSTARNSLAHFSHNFFVIPMNTAILALLVHQIPYEFTGHLVLSTIMYILALVLFIGLALVSLARWMVCFKKAQNQTSSSIDELALLGAAPIAFLTLSTLTGVIVSQARWGGHAFTLVGVVMWWLGVAWMLITSIGVIITVIRRKPALLEGYNDLSPSILLPVVGLATAAVTGAVLTIYSVDLSARLAVPIIVVGYMLNGLAFVLALYLYGLLLLKLFVSGWPPGPKLPSLFFFVGPMGQIPAALIMMSSSAASQKMNFAHYNKGTFLTQQSAQSLNSASIMLALLLLGHEVFWIVVAIWGVIEGAIKRQLVYNIQWWATIFPLATFTTAMLGLSTAMDSPTWKVLTTALIVILYLDYFVNWAFTLYYCIVGDMIVKKPNRTGDLETA